MLTVLATVASLSAGASLAVAGQQQAPPQQEAPQQGAPDRQPAPQQPPAPTQPAPEEPALQSISGELSSVDTEKKTLTVKVADGAEMIFTYNDETKVSGSQESVAGLATSSGSTVSVEFTQEGDEKIATSIDVGSKA
jgi:glucose/arabinose dehydrogenase